MNSSLFLIVDPRCYLLVLLPLRKAPDFVDRSIHGDWQIGSFKEMDWDEDRVVNREEWSAGVNSWTELRG